jgi:hypothetical protein
MGIRRHLYNVCRCLCWLFTTCLRAIRGGFDLRSRSAYLRWTCGRVPLPSICRFCWSVWQLARSDPAVRHLGRPRPVVLEFGLAGAISFACLLDGAQAGGTVDCASPRAGSGLTPQGLAGLADDSAARIAASLRPSIGSNPRSRTDDRYVGTARTRASTTPAAMFAQTRASSCSPVRISASMGAPVPSATAALATAAWASLRP